MLLIKLIACIGILIGTIVISSVTQAETIHFKTTGHLIKNTKIRIGREHIGFVGDYINLPDGNHIIRIDADHDYILEFTLTINNNDINVTKSSYYPDDCVPELQVTWPEPTIENNKTYKDITNIILGDPIFGKSTGRTSCSFSSMMGCGKRKVILTVSSEPQGGEIWIADSKMESRTDATFSVPYCVSEKTKKVLVRLPGMVNCLESIQLSADSNVSLTCIFDNPK